MVTSNWPVISPRLSPLIANFWEPLFPDSRTRSSPEIGIGQQPKRGSVSWGSPERHLVGGRRDSGHTHRDRTTTHHRMLMRPGAPTGKPKSLGNQIKKSVASGSVRTNGFVTSMPANGRGRRPSFDHVSSGTARQNPSVIVPNPIEQHSWRQPGAGPQNVISCQRPVFGGTHRRLGATPKPGGKPTTSGAPSRRWACVLAA